jgi:L-asparaginase
MSTGGTIDSSIEYDNTKKSVFQGTNLPTVLNQARLTCRIELEPLMQKDSADITDEDRTIILERCRASRERNIVITHGTDTISETARFLGEHQVGNKTVVLVGSFVPISQEHSDALFNLGYAIASAQSLSLGVWVAMGGESFSWDNVKKNKDKQMFERLQ